jgi:IS5 family transposase
VLLCAAGYNIRWLLRMIVKKGLGLLLCLLQEVGLMALWQKFAAVIDQTRLKSSTECPALA